MQTWNAGMPWRRSAPPQRPAHRHRIPRAVRRRPCPIMVAAFIRLVGQLRWRRRGRTRRGVVHGGREERLGTTSLSLWCPPRLPMMPLAGDLDSTAAGWLMLRMLMQRGPLLRQRVTRCRSDDAPVVEMMTFSVFADKDSLWTATTGAECPY